MNPFKHVSYSLAAMLLCSSYAFASADTEPVTTKEETPVFTITIGTEIMDGDTTYRIGYPVTTPDGMTYNGYFPFSELKWPLDTTLAKLGVSAEINDSWTINATVKKNITDPDANMEDSDWITDSNPDRLDIFSESLISDFDAVIFDANFEWDFFEEKKYSFFTGIGYQYQNFQYTANLIYQTSPSGLSGYDVTMDGNTPGITYEISYHIPYVLVGSKIDFSDKFSFKGVAKFSPMTTAFDEDNHLLRENGGKISESDMTGTAFMIDLTGKYSFSEYVWLALGFQLTQIDVSGDQDQRYVNGGAIGKVEVESESTQYSGSLNLGIDF